MKLGQKWTKNSRKIVSDDNVLVKLAENNDQKFSVPESCGTG